MFILLLFISFFLLFPPSTQAIPVACPANYPLCFYDYNKGINTGDCLSRQSTGCLDPVDSPNPGYGDYCCKQQSPPTPAPSCVANGNYCVPANVACDPGDVRGSGGTCLADRTCCRITSPPPSPSGSGGSWGSPAGGIPPAPGSSGSNFTPLQYPCGVTIPNSAFPNEEEFHPLRPYPGSPCDPLIPKIVPEAKDAGDKKYISFTCGKSINAGGSFTFPKAINAAGLPLFPGDAAAEAGRLYKCSIGLYPDVCVVKRTAFDVTLNSSSATFPILGNTQNLLDDATKVNNYVNWYLAGTNPSWLDDIDTGPGNPAASCTGTQVANYVNAVLTALGTSRPSNARLLSPAFNLTSRFSPPLFDAMVTAGAKFNQLDGFAGNTYTLPISGGVIPAYDWYAVRPAAGTGPTWKQVFASAAPGKQVVFTEYGDFRTGGQTPEVPNNPVILADMKNEFNRAAGDNDANGGVKAVVYFNAFGTNPGFMSHLLGDVQAPPNELGGIIGSTPGKAGVNSGIGVDGVGNFGGRVNSNGAAWAVELVFSPGDTQGAIDAVNNSPSSVLTVIRPCAGSSCGFSNPSVYAQFIKDVSAGVRGKQIWFIVGPNEPETESWASPTCGSAASSQFDRFLTYSGPLKKLLPQNALTDLKAAMISGGRSKTDIHDYRVDDANRRLSQFPGGLPPSDNFWRSLFQRISLASLEDTVGEITISLIPNQQPGNTFIQDWFTIVVPDLKGSDPAVKESKIIPDTSGSNAITLTIKPSDSRLYFSGVRLANALSEILSGLSRPKDLLWGPITPDSNEAMQKITQHQGFEDSTPIQIKYGEGNYPNTQITRNTQVRDNLPAPTPLFTQYDQVCDLSEVRVNPGDALVGNTITAHLAYAQKIRYTPEATTPGCMSGDNGVPNQCNGGYAGNDVNCCTNQCNWRDGTRQYPCTAPGRYDCGTYCTTAADLTVPTEARVATFMKTPLVERIYYNLITAPASFLRHLLPGPPIDFPADRQYLRGEKNPAMTIPGAADVSYSGNAVPDPAHPDVPNSAQITAGDKTSGGRIYFPRIGSLFDYFLGAASENKNLQRLLRPLRGAFLSTPPLPLSGDCNTVAAATTSAPACPSGSNLPFPYPCGINSELKTIIQEAGGAYRVPPAIIAGVMSIETRNGVFGIPRDEVSLHNTYGAYTPYFCQPNTCGAMGAMQLLTGYGVQPSCSQAAGINRWAEYACKSGSGNPNPGNLRDSVFAGTKMIKAISGTTSAQNSNWSQATVFQVAERYYGSCSASFNLKSNIEYANSCIPVPPVIAEPDMTYCDYLWYYYSPRR
ncbi:MAG: hypothetical protein UX93_C0002G0200 [Microgenomates group bacterium GW2011_GWC1_47_20]|nr:MAG: hypothetical protein UX93_C0002G0200 [Microgenomates group bacterium GW2011_GWC1_47_20]